jgi:hypothetical protein
MYVIFFRACCSMLQKMIILSLVIHSFWRLSCDVALVVSLPPPWSGWLMVHRWFSSPPTAQGQTPPLSGLVFPLSSSYIVLVNRAIGKIWMMQHPLHSWSRPASPTVVKLENNITCGMIGSVLLLKGTVARDFLPLVFFHESTPMGPWFMLQNIFDFYFEFADKFEFESGSAGYHTPQNKKPFSR